MLYRVLGWLLAVSADVAILSEQLLDAVHGILPLLPQLPSLRHGEGLLPTCLVQVFVPLEL